MRNVSNFSLFDSHWGNVNNSLVFELPTGEPTGDMLIMLIMSKDIFQNVLKTLVMLIMS